VRQRAALCAMIPTSAAISLSCFPEAASNTLRARSTMRTERECARAHCSSASFCSGLSTTGWAKRMGKNLSIIETVFPDNDYYFRPTLDSRPDLPLLVDLTKGHSEQQGKAKR